LRASMEVTTLKNDWQKKYATETEALKSNEFFKCACGNVIPRNSVHCPLCRRFNHTAEGVCPTCGQKLVPKTAEV
jgi:rubrerythrin